MGIGILNETKNISTGNIVIINEGTYEIIGNTDKYNIYINCKANIILMAVNIDLSIVSKSAILLGPKANVTLIIKGSNSITSGDNYSGIQMNGKCRIVIQEGSNNSTLNIYSGTSGAGIGGGMSGDLLGDVIIQSGYINIFATREGAGIGGGNGCNGNGNLAGSLTINGGNINISSGLGGGAGIGGGAFGSLTGAVIINGGILNSTKVKGGQGAGIGGGYEGDLSGTVTINDGYVLAEGGEGAAGIGGGMKIIIGGNLSGIVNINGGNTTAIGGAYTNLYGGAGIGGGYNGDLSGTININNGEITAYGPGDADDIGSGSNGVVTGNVNVIIKSVEIIPKLLNLTIGKSNMVTSIVTFEATINTRVEAYEKVEYKSDNTNVATVDQNGLVTGVGIGQTNIVATSVVDSSKSDFCVVNVDNNGIKIGEIDLVVKVNKNEISEGDLNNVICTGVTNVFSAYLQEDINKPVSEGYKNINAYLLVVYTVDLSYTTSNSLSRVIFLASKSSETPYLTNFVIPKEQSIDVSKFEIVLYPKYEVDKNYSRSYYLFKVTGDIMLYINQ